ncbi:hypothetical protein KCTC52924_01841 [Arenibacter antarcticus]|uniref:DUF748 domain-containing protein n=1 Tax=Arenibacter antarcticus TaxID=2040469 RepID=A0ABW5VLI6_9FLAO|nr:hypothetical protein [Arenibacter sp. H213]MCM4166986.1 hypothetical protein [Arenibacter sp. H213]
MSRKKAVRIIFILISLFIGLVMVAQLMAKSRVANFLSKKVPKHIHLDYEGLTVNVLSGSIRLKEVRLDFYNPDTLLRHTSAIMEALNFKGLGYGNLLFNNTVSFRNVELLEPVIMHFPDDLLSPKNAAKTEEVGRDISIANFNIADGEYILMQQKPDSVKLKIDSFNLSLSQVGISTETLKNKIPFTYEALTFNSHDLFVDLGPYEVLKVAEVDLVQKEAVFKNITLTSKYNKRELSRILIKERDHIDLKIPEVLISQLDFGYDEGRFFLNIDKGIFSDPSLRIYRDKLVPDDFDPKKLYSQMLREMPLELDVAELKINRGYISYAELVTQGIVPGEIIFSDLDADLKRISNTKTTVKGDGTTIEINALLMGKAPLILNWNFDPQMENDAFLVSGELRDFNSKSINPFLISNLRAEANGDIKELFFTFSGDKVSSIGDMKMKYQDFGFVILQKNRGGVNKLLTLLGNIFTNDGSQADLNGYRYGSIEAERDVSKSFFNYLWLNVKEGVLSTLTGNGKQD